MYIVYNIYAARKAVADKKNKNIKPIYREYSWNMGACVDIRTVDNGLRRVKTEKKGTAVREGEIKKNGKPKKIRSTLCVPLYYYTYRT